jgi:hypothetical protein
MTPLMFNNCYFEPARSDDTKINDKREARHHCTPDIPKDDRPSVGSCRQLLRKFVELLDEFTAKPGTFES